jgi:hypothetical protein
VVEVFCVPPEVAALDAAARGRGRVCKAALPLCVTAVVTSTLSVQCGGVCSCVWVSVCMSRFDFRERQCAVVSVRCCVAASLRCCAAVCGTALHWTVAVAVSGSSRAAAVAMLGSLRSGCGAVS